ncbi:MAG: aldo/keto reductase [Chromatiales bacterium]|jgi:aryl-alcohol dehydrogenase-like predicted oxidoreductase|nr:aldo/keto reductase [Chromatiales bacterium]
MIETRPFGRTGHASTVTLFGAAALARSNSDDASRTLEMLLEHGVNHIDTAARYGDSELLVGAWMPEHRKDFFLATKTGERDYAAARDQIHRSLERLRVDHVDLLQLHSMAHPDDWDKVFSAEGALEAVVEAREQGLTRHIGITGHSWTIAAMHRRSLERFDFDSVLMPLNYVMYGDERYRNSFEEVVATCKSRNVAVQTIKSVARGPWATSDKDRNTWYQPLEGKESIDRAMHWIMGRGDVFINTAGDINILPRILDAASRFETRPTDADMEELMAAESMSSLFGLAT